MSLLNSLLKIEELLTCKICNNALEKTHVVGECGHNFCYECVSEKLGREAECPTCHLPAVIKNLHKSLMYDNLLAHTVKLKQVVLGDSYIFGAPSQDTNATLGANSDIKKLETPNEIDELETTSNQDVGEEEKEEEEEEEEEKKTEGEGEGEDHDTVNLLGLNYMGSFSSLSEMEDEKEPKDEKEVDEKQLKEKEEDPKEIDGKADCTDKEYPYPAKKRKLSNSQSNGEADDHGFSININTPSTTDNKKTSKPGNWKCQWCSFEHEAFIQTCSMCRKYKRSEYVPRELPPPLEQENNRHRSSNGNSSQSKNNNMKDTQGTQKIPLKRKLEEEMEEIHILSTGLSEKEETSIKRNITSAAKAGMRITVHNDFKKFDQVTHLITSVDKKGLCKRTLKYLQGVVRGKWIVDQNWLNHSVKREQWLREQPYEVKGDLSAGATNAPSKGRKYYEEKRSLFGDMNFYFSGDFPSKYNKKDLAQLCEVAGGNLLKRKPALPTGNTIVIHSIDSKDTHTWLDGFVVKDPSWIIDSVSKLSTKD